MPAYNFDDCNIRWNHIEEFNHFLYSILKVDEQSQIIDVLFKFEANKQIVLHRHRAVNTSFVVQGEHYLYQPNGELKEVREVGSFTTSPASDEPHRECGGNEGAIVLFSIRGSDGVLYEMLDDERNQIATLTMQDFVDLFKEQSVDQ